MTKDEISEIVRTTMPEQFYTRPGAVLMSGASTLKPSTACIMGLNPGGDPMRVTRPLIDAPAGPDGTSPYTHECWLKTCNVMDGPCEHIGPDGMTYANALVVHQRRVIELARTLGTTPGQLYSANAIFGRSTSIAALKSETGFTLKEWWEACWPVHQKLLAIVRPKMLITLGYGESSSAFGLLRAMAGRPDFRRFGDEGRAGGWIFDASLPLGPTDTLETSVIGIPHPSYLAAGPILSRMLMERCQ